MNAVRTCVGCRQQGFRAELIRVIFSQGTLAFDHGKVLPGRGSWLHPKLSCFNLALERGSFARSFRAKLNLETLAKLKEQAEKMLDK
jgi:predicted RNA-binding protein YlxR (DUF448 family)